MNAKNDLISLLVSVTPARQHPIKAYSFWWYFSPYHAKSMYQWLKMLVRSTWYIWSGNRAIFRDFFTIKMQ